jgi:hypothetical protein
VLELIVLLVMLVFDFVLGPAARIDIQGRTAFIQNGGVTYQTEQMSKKSVRRAVLFSSLCGISLQLIETFARSAAGDLWCCDSCRLLAAKKEVYQIAFSQGRPNMGSWQHAILPGRGVSEFQRTFDSIH